jgi:hypothetical protein
MEHLRLAYVFVVYLADASLARNGIGEKYVRQESATFPKMYGIR